MLRVAFICSLVLLSGSGISFAQTPSIADSSAKVRSDTLQKKEMKTGKVQTADTAKESFEPDFTNRVVYDFFTTANALYYDNARTDEQKNELNFYYNVTLNNSFKTKSFTIRTYFFNEYGLRYFPDSLTIKGQDGYIMRNTLLIPITKKLRFQLGGSVKSQLWKTYSYRLDTTSGDYQKYLYSSYFSPGYLLYTCGTTLIFLKTATLDIGLVGGKTTKIKNQTLFDERRTQKLYGVQKGEKKTFTYGVSMLLNVPPRKLNKHFGWECHAMVYIPKDQLGRLKGYTLDAMNVFHYMFLSNLRVSLRTQALYDESVSHKLFLMNTLSIGFYLSNKI